MTVGRSRFHQQRHRRSNRSPEASSANDGVRRISPEHHACEIRAHLQQLGSEYSCLALYLSSRIDALPAECCRELALVPDAAPAMPPAEIQIIMAAELGEQLERAFAEFNLRPVESSLISQSHQAVLRTGAPVMVVVLRPGFYKFQKGTDAHQVLDPLVLANQFGEWITDEILRDFIAVMQRKTSLKLWREGMELTARDAASFELLQSHRSYAELSTNNLLTFETLEEESLDRLLERHSIGTDSMARQLCHVWLQQALHGHCFPADPQPGNIRFHQQRRISFLNCDLMALPQAAKENLLSYFNCILADDPDRAVMYLMREMTPRKATKIDADSFRSSFRQAAYFGMLEPILGTNSNALAQMVFQHWKTMLDHGYVPRPHLLCFYRGLFSVARIARKLAPDSDPLREGMVELRSSNAFNQLREIMNWRYWMQNSDKFASAMVQFPRAFDDALTRASTPSSIVPEEGLPRTPESGTISPVFLLLLSVAVVVISQLPKTQGWQDKIFPGVLLVVGLLVLRGLNR
ncbi:MAG TPA: AarF/UbiB family protein [Candidatus Angelobacter sp.]|jgi:ubiquinone biosynthesis protein|nr:AarF/UbiB family protein [Candidatus Angelobacter sp.]